jgi:hypothetical protein
MTTACLLKPIGLSFKVQAFVDVTISQPSSLLVRPFVLALMLLVKPLVLSLMLLLRMSL